MLTPVEEIKQRLDVVDFISNYLPLKKAGANFRGLCPFHTEKTPSFMVSRPKQIWHCFGCQEGGDIFAFAMKMDGIEFGEALRLLAQKANIELPHYDPQLNTLRNTVLNVLDAAKDLFGQALRSEVGLFARQYLNKRGLDEATIKLFAIGYAPNTWDALLKELVKKFKPEDIFAAGLTVKKDNSASYYDRFRHRLMFPIRDLHGNVIGFTGRLLDETQQGGKYVNTPETIVYDKSKVLYGLDLAKNAIREKDLAVFMEGQMDVITAHQFGFHNAIASSGTALTPDQLKIIKRYTNSIALAFDADSAGQEAMKRGIDLALSDGMQVKIIGIPKDGGKDPDECIRKSIQVWQKSVDQALDIIDWYIQNALNRYNISDAQGRKNFVQVLFPNIARLPSAVEQDFWLQKIAGLLNVDLKIIQEDFKKYKSPRETQTAKITTSTQVTIAKKTRQQILGDRLITTIIAAPDFLPLVISRVTPEMLADGQVRALYIRLIEYYNRENDVNNANSDTIKGDFADWLQKNEPNLLSFYNICELESAKDFSDWTQEAIKHEGQFLSQSLRQEFFHLKREELTKLMREAEAKGDRDRIADLTRSFAEINAQE